LERFYNHGVIKSLMSASQDDRKVQNGIPIPSKHSSYIDSKSFAVALLGSLDKNKPIPEIADIEKMVNDATLPDVVRNVLSGALLTAGNDITKVRDQIADWFDDIMDRLNGVYRRQAKWIALLVGLAIAAIFNVDSISVGNSLWRDQTLRGQLVSSAEEIEKSPPASCAIDGKPPADSGEVLTCAKKELDDIRPLPIGWPAKDFPPTLGSEIWFGLIKVFGWILTAVALSLGAPFWFDVLAKFMSIRGTGKKPKPANQ
jgi:hypothetical protein